MNRLSSASTSS